MSPEGRYQEGRVLQADDKPCFAVADNKESRTKRLELTAISVYEVLDIGTQKRWELSSKKGNSINPSECISYAAQPSMTRTETEPTPLEVGKRYSMTIGSFAMKKHPNVWELREYRAYFCITKDEQTQKITVHQVHYDDELGKTRWDICGITN